MMFSKSRLLSTTVIPFVAGAGVIVGTALVSPAPSQATAARPAPAPLPAAKPRPDVRLVACNPCNPCAAKKACNPCNPCGASAAVEISPREAAAVYDCLRTEMASAYDKAGVATVAGYTNWTNVATQPYPSATHGNRYVNNYANARGAYKYVEYEDVGTMPAGAAIAKDSFVVNANGTVSVGPLFVMEKMSGGFNAESHDWRYSLIMPTGAVVGVTGGKGAANVKFCIECHASVADDQDSLFFLPDEVREKFN